MYDSEILTLDSVSQLSNSPKRHHGMRSNQGMNFILYQASGGYIIEYEIHHYMKENEHRLHIIPPEKDLGQGIAEIVTLELLRK